MEPINPRTALDLMETGVVVQGVDLGIVWANRYAADILGLGADDLRGITSHDPRWDPVHTDGTPYPGDTHPAALAIRTGAPVRGAVMGVARPRSGDRVWLQVSALPARDAEGRVIGAVTTLTNISATRSAQVDLEEMNAHLGRLVEERTHELASLLRKHRESEELHRAVIRAMAEGVVVHSPDGSIRDANPAAEAILGLTLDQMQGRHPVDPQWGLTGTDGLPLPSDQIPSEITRTTGEPVTNRILRVRRPGGRMRWLSVSTDPVRIEGDAALQGIVATFSDITAEREAAQALERSRTFLQQVMASVPGVLMRTVHRDGGHTRITFVSDDVQPMLGLTPEALMADAGIFTSRVHPDDLSRLRVERHRMIAEGRGSSCTVRIRASTDEWRWIRIHSSPPVESDEGTVLHATLFDVTEERRMEQGLRLAQRQEALGVLAGGIAHNFNNMLAVILPSLELASELGGPEVEEALVDASRATKGASSLVRQLLRLARRESSEDAQKVALETVVDEVVALARRIFSRRITLNLERPDRHLPVMGRRDELEQVILNLLINARDAVEGADDPTISVDADVADDEVAVTVRDNGCGMPDEVSRRLGQPFFTTKDPGRGTGLGLATAMGIAADLGGRLEWHSAGPGRGSSFRLVLPLTDREPTPPPQPPGSGNAPSVEIDGARVLVVDDEPMVVKSVVRLLARLVPDISTAPDGEETLRLLEAGERFDVVLVDFSMPGMDGGELTRAIKDRHPEQPVLIMTGYVREPDQVAAADGVIQKPFSGSELRGALRPWLLKGVGRD